MKTLTLRGLDNKLSEKLKKIARQEGKSVNQLIIETLKIYFGFNKKPKYTVKHHDMDHLFGKWSDDEYNRIQKKINSERKVDKEIWK